MNDYTLLLTTPGLAAFAVEPNEDGVTSQQLVQVWLDARRSSPGGTDGAEVAEVEIVEQSECEAAPLNPNLCRLASAIRHFKPQCPLANFA